MGKDQNDDIDDIVYKGFAPTNSEHDSFLGSLGSDGEHVTFHEDSSGGQRDDS